MKQTQIKDEIENLTYKLCDDITALLKQAPKESLQDISIDLMTCIHAMMRTIYQDQTVDTLITMLSIESKIMQHRGGTLLHKENTKYQKKAKK